MEPLDPLRVFMLSKDEQDFVNRHLCSLDGDYEYPNPAALKNIPLDTDLVLLKKLCRIFRLRMKFRGPKKSTITLYQI